MARGGRRVEGGKSVVENTGSLTQTGGLDPAFSVYAPLCFAAICASENGRSTCASFKTLEGGCPNKKYLFGGGLGPKNEPLPTVLVGAGCPKKTCPFGGSVSSTMPRKRGGGRQLGSKALKTPKSLKRWLLIQPLLHKCIPVCSICVSEGGQIGNRI